MKSIISQRFCGTLHFIRKCNRWTCKLFWLYKIFSGFKPVECTERQKKEKWSRTVSNCARSHFHQYANYMYLPFHQAGISWLTLSKGKKTLKKRCVYASVNSSPPPPPPLTTATAGHLPSLSVPRVGHLQVLRCPRAGHLPVKPEFLTRTRFPIRI